MCSLNFYIHHIYNQYVSDYILDIIYILGAQFSSILRNSYPCLNPITVVVTLYFLYTHKKNKEITKSDNAWKFNPHFITIPQ